VFIPQKTTFFIVTAVKTSNLNTETLVPRIGSQGLQTVRREHDAHRVVRGSINMLQCNESLSEGGAALRLHEHRSQTEQSITLP
jgi:hypothetical protein